MTKAILPMSAAVVLIALTTIVQGNWTERWGRTESEVLSQWGARIKDVPLRFGDWVGVAREEETETRIKNIAGFTEELAAHFKNERTGDEVDFVLVCGPGRRVSVHTPDKCLRGAGYSLGDQPKQRNVEGGEVKAEFLTAPFVKEDPEKIERLRVLWTWHNGDRWSAPTPFFSKMRFSREKALYKMYVFCNMQKQTDKFEESAAVKFAQDFLPVVTAALFPSAEGEPAEGDEPAGEAGEPLAVR